MLAPLCRDARTGEALCIDLTAGISLALPLAFDDAQPRHFGAPPARSTPYVAGSFNGEVARGASCNCRSVTLVPHCNGTHTEGAGHLTIDCPPLHAQIPSQPLPALLLSVTPQAAASSDETSLPPPQPGDSLITGQSLLAAWPASLPFAPQVLVLRTQASATQPSGAGNDATNPPYLTLHCAQTLVARGILHLVIDLPSIDRSQDEGRLSAHRVLFGLSPGVTDYAAATRPQATVTELAHIDASLPDGPCAVQLQVPAWTGDALPSRPLLFALVTP